MLLQPITTIPACPVPMSGDPFYYNLGFHPKMVQLCLSQLHSLYPSFGFTTPSLSFLVVANTLTTDVVFGNDVSTLLFQLDLSAISSELIQASSTDIAAIPPLSLPNAVAAPPGIPSFFFDKAMTQNVYPLAPLFTSRVPFINGLLNAVPLNGVSNVASLPNAAPLNGITNDATINPSNHCTFNNAFASSSAVSAVEPPCPTSLSILKYELLGKGQSGVQCSVFSSDFTALRRLASLHGIPAHSILE